MNSQNRFLVYFILGFVGFSTLLITDAYALTIPRTYQGTGGFDSQSTQSWLNWEISTTSGEETGRTDSVLGIGSTLAFLQDNNSLKNVKKIIVYGTIDQINIGSNFCYTTPNWKVDQTLKVNGIPYNLPKALLTQEFDPVTQQWSGKGLRFEPQIVESYLANQGVILFTGDTIEWTVTARNDFELYEGLVDVDIVVVGDEFGKDPSGIGDCEVKTKVVGGKVSNQAETQKIFYTVGMKFGIELTWLNVGEQVIQTSILFSDIDGDGIADEFDLCTFEPENINGFEDEDGCADVLPLTPEQEELLLPILGDDEIIILNEDGVLEIIKNLDDDNDGIPNDLDFCPNEPENYDGINDLDGCPDGTLITNVNFLDANGNPIIFDPTVTPLVNTPNKELFDFIAEQGGTLPVVVVDIDTGLIIEEGISDECNPIFENCSEIILEAVRQIEKATGIKLPFEPSIINLAIFFAIVGVVIFMIGKATKKI